MSALEQLEIDSLAYHGAGVARNAEGKVFFVKGALPGETVEAQVIADKGGYATAQLARILEPSAQRVDALCPYASRCGACPWQVLAYDQQLFWKRRIVVDALQHIGRFSNADELVLDCIAAQQPWGYRNKIELVALTQGTQVSLCMHADDSNAPVPIESCLLVSEKHRTLPKKLAGALSYLNIDAKSAVKRVGLRLSRRSGDLEIALWGNPGAFPRAIAAKVLSSAVKNTSIVRVLFTGAQKERKLKGVEVLRGNGYWRENFLGHSLKLSAPSFFQVNTSAAELLVLEAMRALEDRGYQQVLDLYSGVGTFTLPLCERFDDVTAIESASASIADLRRALAEAHLDAEIIGGDVARILPSIPFADAALIDPPRAGLSKLAQEAIAASSLARLVYVSCNPATLARDAAALERGGFRLVSVCPVDLFAQSYHIESVSVFDRAHG
ncbi:MAG: 23S rRNA (uracil(1939)-C(5))-methyltransferase RlmD [Coriobacteriales bacterium]|jgi:23S rRNA (uracil1939-C5)-methyltransferase|nr:23S rRNA (uracil(1939)-C(5))-methyltransferase RlmD [Coriobacteriales bacterium]